MMTGRYRHKISPSSRLFLLEDKGYALLSQISKLQKPGSILPISIEVQKREFINDPWYSTHLEPECRSIFEKTNCLRALKKSFKYLIRTKTMLNRVKTECNPSYLSKLTPFVPYACTRAQRIAMDPSFFFHCPTCTSLIYRCLSNNLMLDVETTINHCDLHSSNFIDSLSAEKCRSGWIDLENICLAPYFTDLLQYFFVYSNASVLMAEDISVLIQDAGRFPVRGDVLFAIVIVLIHWRILNESNCCKQASSIEVNFHQAICYMKAISMWQHLL